MTEVEAEDALRRVAEMRKEFAAMRELERRLLQSASVTTDAVSRTAEAVSASSAEPVGETPDEGQIRTYGVPAGDK
jgi:hypothetical protein